MISAFEVLAEPHRRRILDLLRVCERAVGELVRDLALSQPAVSKHLRILREAGLVEVRGDAQRRLYRVRPEGLREVDLWLEPYRRMWAARLDDLDRHLEVMDMHDDAARRGTLDQLDDGRWQLQFRRTLPHPRQKVWRAITEPEGLAHWFPTTIEGERAPGARLRFSFPGGQASPFDGEMLSYDPPRLMEFLWGPPEGDVMRLELEEVPGGTVLTLRHTLDQRGKAARDAAGWHVCLDGLATHLRGAAGAREGMATWKDVHPGYVERFGPEAATIGPPAGFE